MCRNRTSAGWAWRAAMRAAAAAAAAAAVAAVKRLHPALRRGGVALPLARPVHSVQVAAAEGGPHHGCGVWCNPCMASHTHTRAPPRNDGPTNTNCTSALPDTATAGPVTTAATPTTHMMRGTGAAPACATSAATVRRAAPGKRARQPLEHHGPVHVHPRRLGRQPILIRHAHTGKLGE